MLTKWGSALGLASAGRIVSLSGGGPLGDATIWGAVGIWADLSTIPAGDIRNNDEVPVNGLGTSHSSGIAQRHGSEWRLIEGRWNSVADMLAWNTTPGNVVHTGAFALVKSGGGHDDDSVTYIYQSGNWVRFAGLTAGYGWALSSLRDFTAIGLQNGDFGLYGNTVYRYNSAVPISGGGTDPMWLPPSVYAGTLSIRGRLVGTEAIGAMPVTVGGITFAVVQNPSAGSTVTQSGDYIQLQTTTSTNNIFYGNALFTTGSAIRTYMQCDISVTYTGTSGAIARVLGSEGSGQPAWWFHLGPSGSLSPLPYFAAGTTLQGSQEAIRDGGIAWPSNASGNYSTTELIDSSRNVATECFRDGISYARSRRSSTTTGPVSPGAGVGFYVQANAFGAGGTLTIRVKNWRILTW